MTEKYLKLRGIRNSHDFLFTRHAATNVLVVKARSLCYTGMFENAPIHVHEGKDVDECAIADQDYASRGKLRPLSESKRKHLEQMYRDFIPSDRHLNFLN